MEKIEVMQITNKEICLEMLVVENKSLKAKNKELEDQIRDKEDPQKALYDRLDEIIKWLESINESIYEYRQG